MYCLVVDILFIMHQWKAGYIQYSTLAKLKRLAIAASAIIIKIYVRVYDTLILHTKIFDDDQSLDNRGSTVRQNTWCIKYHNYSIIMRQSVFIKHNYYNDMEGELDCTTKHEDSHAIIMALCFR